ncbi:transposable element Tcb2 transposase [Trichonephila clavipes]|nr:transposable element Tcb2 transposase [Trichonephila clavipes]
MSLPALPRRQQKILETLLFPNWTALHVQCSSQSSARYQIVRQALVDPTVTRSTIRVDVDVAIVPQTISSHLAEANLKSKRTFHALPLTPEHRQLRLQWCQARSKWDVTDWQKFVFSDESRFVLGTDDNRVRVWRRPAERYNSPHTARTAGVMVWGWP